MGQGTRRPCFQAGGGQPRTSVAPAKRIEESRRGPVAEITGARPELTAQPDAEAPESNRWWVLAVVGLAQLMVVLDATIVNIALPSAQRDLGFSNADRQWIVTAYALGFGGLLLLGGGACPI